MAARIERSKRAKQESGGNVAAAYLALLADRGVDYLFGNAGTDFAPLIEAYSRAAQTGVAVPQPILATHENLAVTMAHGYGMISRRIPAVMVHVSVGVSDSCEVSTSLGASRLGGEFRCALAREEHGGPSIAAAAGAYYMPGDCPLNGRGATRTPRALEILFITPSPA